MNSENSDSPQVTVDSLYHEIQVAEDAFQVWIVYEGVQILVLRSRTSIHAFRVVRMYVIPLERNRIASGVAVV